MDCSAETNKLLNHMSNIPEESVEEDECRGEDAKFINQEEGTKEHLIQNGYDINSGQGMGAKGKGFPGSNDLSECKDSSQHQTLETVGTPDNDEANKEEDTGKTVKFADDVEVYDLGSMAPTPVTMSMTDPCAQELGPSTVFSKDFTDSPPVLPTSASETEAETVDDQHDDSSFPPLTRPSVLPLANPEISLQSSSSHEDLAQDKKSHRQFEVSNVTTPVIEDKDDEVKDGESEENKVSLRKVTSAASTVASGHSSNNQDTIGPLDNPSFLKKLYSNLPVEDSGFPAATSNLDLSEFIGTQVPDLDGGWAWVILFAAFCSLALTGATVFAAGVLMPAILANIDPDIAKVSWIGAVHVSVTCMTGPIVGIVLSRLGARWTAFLAGIVFSSGLVVASQCSSVLQLILSHGLLAGLGSGFILNTMFVTVGQYFNRYRGLACGLLATGSGAGMLAGGSVLTTLFNNFGLSGTYLLWGGITLHILIFSMLLRPSPTEVIREAEDELCKDPNFNVTSQADLRSGHVSMFSGINSMYSADRQSIVSGRTNYSRRFQRFNSGSKQDLSVAPLLKSVLHKEMSRSTFSVGTNRSRKSHRRSLIENSSPSAPREKGSISTNAIDIAPSSPSAQSRFVSGPSNRTLDANEAFTPSPGTSPMLSSPLTASDQVKQNSPLDKSKFDNLEIQRLLSRPSMIQEDQEKAHSPSSPTNSFGPSERSRSFRHRCLSVGSQAGQSQYTSHGQLSRNASIREQLACNDFDNESLASTLVSHLQPRDSLAPRYKLGSRSISSLMGSIASFPTALAIVKDDLQRVDDLGQKKTLKGYFIGFLDSLRLLRNKPFLMFITTCFLWAFGDSPFGLYLPAYAISKGTTVMQASSLYTGMGFGSMCGRFLAGLVASDSSIGPLLLHIGCLSVAGFLVCLTPLITATYMQQMTLAILFGLYSGSLVPLSSLITIELLGIGELGLGFGILSLAQGIGYLIGPPLGGIIVKLLGYELGFVFAGLLLLSGSMLAMLIAILLKDAPDEDVHDSFDDLERALRRISETDSGGSDDDSVQEDEHVWSRHRSIGSFHGSYHHGGSFHGGSFHGGSFHGNLYRKKDEVDSSPGEGGGDTSGREATQGEQTYDEGELETIAEEAEKYSMQGLD